MWFLLVFSIAHASDVWRSEGANGSISFTDSPPASGDYVRFNVDGPPPVVKNVTIRNFPNLDKFDGLITQASIQYGVPATLIKAVVLAESGMNPDAVSHAGAQGLMQLMPATAKDLGVMDSFDPIENIDGGSRYLAKMLDIFNGDRRLSLAGYNAGPNRVKRTMTVPAIEETQTYVKRVLALERHFSIHRPITTLERL
jgi:soluble lytic murein transglycosylase-like protein